MFSLYFLSFLYLRHLPTFALLIFSVLRRHRSTSHFPCFKLNKQTKTVVLLPSNQLALVGNLTRLSFHRFPAFTSSAFVNIPLRTLPLSFSLLMCSLHILPADLFLSISLKAQRWHRNFPHIMHKKYFVEYSASSRVPIPQFSHGFIFLCVAFAEPARKTIMAAPVYFKCVFFA